MGKEIGWQNWAGLRCEREASNSLEAALLEMTEVVRPFKWSSGAAYRMLSKDQVCRIFRLGIYTRTEAPQLCRTRVSHCFEKKLALCLASCTFFREPQDLRGMKGGEQNSWTMDKALFHFRGTKRKYQSHKATNTACYKSTWRPQLGSAFQMLS